MSGPKWVCLLDRPALSRRFARSSAAGSSAIVKDGFGAVALVFEDVGGNLVTFFASDHWAGRVAFGGVAEPDAYVAGYEEYRRELEAW